MLKDYEQSTRQELIEDIEQKIELLESLNNKILLLENENQNYKDLFECSPTPMWEEDITELIQHLNQLKKDRMLNIEELFDSDPRILEESIKKIKILNINSAAVKLHDANSKQELIENLPDLFTELSLEAFKKEIVAISEGKVEYESETNAKTFKGQIIDLKLNLKINERKIDGEKKYFALVSTNDITKQKNAELNLKRNERNLREILDASEDVAELVDPNGYILEVNRSCRDQHNKHRLDMLDRQFFEFYDPEVKARRMNFLKIATEKKEKIDFQDYAFGRKWHNIISPLTDLNDKVNKLVLFSRNITSEHEALEKLKESELKYKLIFDNVNISILHINKIGFITDINQFHLKNIGGDKVSKSEYVGTNVLERETLQRAEVVENYKRLLEGIPFSLKHVRFPKTTGGTEEYFNLNGIPLFDDNKFNGAIVTAELVTDEIRNKEKIKLTEQRLGLALKAAHISFWEYNLINKEMWRFGEWQNLLGYKESEIGNTLESWGNLLHPDDKEKTLTKIKDHFRGRNDQINIEHRLRRSNGNYVWVLNWGKVTEYDRKGKAVKVSGVLININEKKIAEANERLVLNSYNEIFNNSIDAIYVLDKDGQFIEVNSAAEKMYGYRAEEFVGQTPAFLSAPGKNNMQEVQEYLKRAYNGEQIEFDFWGLRKDGTTFPKIVRLNSILYNGEKAVVAFGLDITDRYYAEQTLKESEAKYSALVEQANEGIIINQDWKIKYCNKHLVDLLGYKEEEILNTSIDMFMPEAARELSKKYFEARMREENVPNIYESEAVRKDGEIIPIEINAIKTIFNGKPAVQSIVRNISERKKGEALLRKTKQQLEFAIEGSGAGLWDWYIQTGKCEFSERWAEIIGYHLDELKPLDINTWMKYANPDDLQKSNEELKRHFSGESEVYICEARMKHKNGDWIWVLDRGKVVEWDNNGQPLRMVGTHIDITDRKKAESELKLKEDNLRAILNTSLDAIILLEKDGRIIETNENFRKIIKTDRDSLVGKNFFELPKLDSLSNKHNMLSKVLETKSNAVFIENWLDTVWEISIYPILDQNTNVNRLSIFAKDITETFIYEEKLKESNERLKKLSRYLNRVREEERKKISREVHDNLGQTLTALNLELSWVKQNIPEEQKELKKQIDPILELINLSIVTVQEISTELRPGILDDLGLVNAIQWQCNKVSRKSNLRFKLDLLKEEINLSEELKTVLFRVFQEALTNIIRHSKAQNISVNLQKYGKDLLFEIIDDGIGISQDKLNDFSSLGIIGMRESIESINGKFEINCENQQGTKIKIVAPLTELL